MPPERSPRRPRQEPVSCQLCRSKKLKCNREDPCQNCLARGITCERQARLPTNLIQHVPAAAETATDILARLQRLEDLVLGSDKAGPSAAAAQPQRSRSVASSQISEREKAHKADAKWLESIALREQSLLSGLSGGISIRVGPLQQMPLNYSTLRTNADGTVSRCVWLPLQTEAALLCENYATHVDYIYRVLHLPTVRTLLHELYLRLARGLDINLGHVALLLSIFANSAYFWIPTDCDGHLYVNVQAATQSALLWSKAALDVMDHSSRTLARGIEDVQARMVLGLLVYNFEGFSAVVRSLHASALTIAQSLNLHRTDCGINKEGDKKSRDRIIEIDIRRRVWWHLSATDWIMALNGGPQEGTYHIHPKHMKVLLPRNANDEDLDDEVVNLPLFKPTSMSYFLQRIRVGELSRNIADCMPLTLSDPEETNYDDVILLDGKFEKFLSELPVFFRLDEESLRQSREIDRRYPHIPIQRYMINGGTHMRRYKLHQPFLIRGQHDSRYLYSRDACLRSARAVIHVQQHLDKEADTVFASVHHRLCPVVHFVFAAIMVLVMDLCFNKVEGKDEERQNEVLSACKVLERAREQSTMASRFLDSLLDILRKHKIRLPINSTGLIDIPGGNSAAGVAAPAAFTPSSMETVTPFDAVQGDATWIKDVNSDVGFDDVWQFTEYGESLGDLDWGHLISDLNTHLA